MNKTTELLRKRFDSTYEFLADGKLYTHSSVESVTTGASFFVSISVPAGLDVYFGAPDIKTDQALTITLYEDSDVAGGSAVTPRNKNRGAGDNSQVVVATSPTVTTPGTNISETIVFAGGDKFGSLNVGSFYTNFSTPTKLKSNAKYLIELANASGSTANFVLRFIWSES